MSDEDREHALLKAAVETLKSGDTGRALAILRDMATPPPMLVAQACARHGDLEGEAAALRLILDRDVRDLPALLAMGNNAVRRQDDRAAMRWFRAALAQAAATGAPAPLKPLLDRAQAYSVAAAQRFEDHLSATIDALPDLPRIALATDLLLGKKTLHLQQPSMFYFPGLPQRAFYEREEFSWVAAVEAMTDAIVQELRTVLADPVDFAPYVETPKDGPAPNNPLRNDSSWSAFHFWRAGEVVEANAARCPAVMDALSLAPMPVIEGRSPMALWSMLKPGTHIRPHNGLLNTRLICHLPILAPSDCALRVGAETRPWRKGEMLLFDDSIEHEAWNRSRDTRVVLLFEIWRPEISVDEREALVTLFQAIDHIGAANDVGDD